MNPAEVHVKMCEVRTGSGHQVLRTTLGSCVGIGLLWRGRDLCGLAHCLLPASNARAPAPSAKFVTDALPSLLQLMGASRPDHRQLEAVLAGGACMVQPVRPAPYGLIGEQNVEMASRLLAEAGIRVIHADTGGSSGRQLVIECHAQQFSVRTFVRDH